MRATVMYGAGDVRVEDRPAPAIEEDTDAIVRVVRTCICGSDLHPYHSMAASSDGTTMGHEMIGVVEQTGDLVSTVTPGDLVIAPFAFSDNTCDICLDGFQTACPHGGYFSTCQSEVVRVPQADGTLVVAPATEDEAILKSYLALSDVYLTGYHAAFMGKVEPGKSVTVIGDGAVGLSAVLAASRMGADRIILMGRHTDRTDLGRDFGATDVVAERGQEGVEKVRSMTDRQGTHVVLEAVGHMAAYEQSYGVVRSGGVISRVGVPQYEDAPVGFMSLFGRNITLTGGPAPVRAYLEQGLKDVTSGLINPGQLFDVTLPLDEAPKGYELMDSRKALKVMLKP
ncbi:zinc-binding dehydrogenase [Arachnia rubra]|jgi:alcohol dehydrogenase groES domain protein|uniref:Alcohol dehydrogenase catalytic domain-containing protein n=1 Tax=Arachnia rubra TaxID=1547448 RepID=A0ABX7Y3B7_9ACTN|nr:alcohol dehydrogenase catalytic domain-containing protein [Arachnia rubra]QUC07672.1 alcohol dehydrogenase catalytic domain-containing protein [Arachnia rubra]BCR81977.1 IMP dehydrogenase [Arachnia rubra]